MKHSGPGRQRALQVALIATDLVGRLTFPAALIALSRGAVSASIAASVMVTVAGTARGFVLGVALEEALRERWRAATAASRRRPVIDRSEATPERVTVLVDAIRESAVFDAQVVPAIVAQLLALAVAAVAVVVMLGPGWLLLGGGAFAALGFLMTWGHSRVRIAQESAWEGFVDVARDMHALVGAAAELRAHARDAALETLVLRRADMMARGERVAGLWSGVTGLVPAGIAVLALALPASAGVDWISSVLGSARVADAAVLGGMTVVVGTGLVRAREAAIRSRPQRRALADFLRTSLDAFGAQGTRRAADVGTSVIEIDDVSHVHEGASHATPAGARARWEPGTGLALTGENGAGKTTLALAMLGLIQPTRGRVLLDGHPVTSLDLDDLHTRVAYLPQGAFVSPSASVAWHLRLLVPDVSDADIDTALERVGLLEPLRQHASRAGVSPHDVPAGELSGGERQRMHLARVLLRRAAIVLLDEPEIGLDDIGRSLMRNLLEEMASSRRVLVIAHDEAVIPQSFQRLECRRAACDTDTRAERGEIAPR